MLEKWRKESADIRRSLLSMMSIAEARYEYGVANIEKVTEFETKLSKVNNDIAELTATANHMTAIYKNIKSYSIKHQERVRNILDLAIIRAGELVPDASVDGIHLNQTENNKVTVVNGLGQNVNLREGGGYRAILGALLRYACLKAQPDALQFILFDEYFFTLSDATTSLMKDVIEEMSKDCTIVCIEQRRNVMDGIVQSEYTFRKGLDGVTKVEKTM